MIERAMKSSKFIILCSTVLSLAACASTPMGPTVQALPPQGKPFDQFQADQFNCKQYADEQVRGQAESANSTGILEGIGGTALGAGLGAAIGGGHGAAIGAAGGALAGTGVGAATSSRQQGGIQVQYNNAYEQCMVAKGNQIERPVAPPPRVVYTPAPPPPPAVVYVQQPPPTVIYTAPPPPPGYR
jgi:outer membrane lipoprotein SlyB